MRSACVLMLGCSIAAAQPGATDPDEPPPTPLGVVDTRAYLASTIQLASAPEVADRSYVARIAAGLWVRRFTAGGGPSLGVRIGASAYSTSFAVPGGAPDGLGVELEVEHLLDLGLRAGLRGSIESSGHGALFTLGGRLYVGDSLFIAVDGFVFVTPMPDAPRGLLFGGGISGRSSHSGIRAKPSEVL